MMWSRVKLGSTLLLLGPVGCALPESGGQTAVVEKRMEPSTGGSSSPSASGGQTAVVEKKLEPSTGGSVSLSASGGTTAALVGSSLAGGSTSFGGSTGSTGGFTANVDAGGGCSGVSDAGFDATCLCSEDGGSKAVIPHGSTILSKLGAGNTGNTCAETFLNPVSAGQVMGFSSYFDAGDRIVSLGAVTSLYGITAVSFKLAIYGSDSNGLPASNLFITPDIMATDTTATNPPPEYKLPSCVRIATGGYYWLMILPNGQKNIDCVKIYTDNSTMPDGNFYYSNGAGTFQPESNWLPTFVPFTHDCTTGTPPYKAAFPHLFARLIPGRG